MLILLKTVHFCLEVENNYTAYGAAVLDELSLKAVFRIYLKWVLESQKSTQNSW